MSNTYRIIQHDLRGDIGDFEAFLRQEGEEVIGLNVIKPHCVIIGIQYLRLIVGGLSPRSLPVRVTLYAPESGPRLLWVAALTTMRIIPHHFFLIERKALIPYVAVPLF